MVGSSFSYTGSISASLGVGFGGDASSSINGLLDDIRIFNYALTSTDRTNLFSKRGYDPSSNKFGALKRRNQLFTSGTL